VPDPSKNRRIRLSVARRMMTDYMWAASGVARVDVIRSVAFADLITVRSGLLRPPSWTAIFAKGFALVASEIPELRRVYMTWPWPHLYEYAESTVCILQEREILGDVGVLPLRFRKPEGIPLAELSEMIRGAAGAPIEDSRFCRALIGLTRLPLLIRRSFWGLCLNVPRLRRYTLGTYGISSAARWQAELGTSRTPHPCLMSSGPADSQGNVDVRLSFDHRIFDGALAGRILSRLDQVLNASILKELQELAKLDAPPSCGRGVSSMPAGTRQDRRSLSTAS
jgi:hypothetical protein